jgi:hypothetical protein
MLRITPPPVPCSTNCRTAARFDRISDGKIQLERSLPSFIGEFVDGPIAVPPTTSASYMIKPIKPAEFCDTLFDRRFSRSGVACIPSDHVR